MGQSQAPPGKRPWAAAAEGGRGSAPKRSGSYAAFGLHELNGLVIERGLAQLLPSALIEDRSALIALLSAYDAGAAAGAGPAGGDACASGPSRSSPPTEGRRSSACMSASSSSSSLVALAAVAQGRRLAWNGEGEAWSGEGEERPDRWANASSPRGMPSEKTAGALSVLQKIRDAPGHMGCDIGGTLVKMILALPVEAADDYCFPATFGKTGRAHNHLELPMKSSNGDRFVLRFISGTTSNMESLVQHLSHRRREMMSEAQEEEEEKEEPKAQVGVFSRVLSDWSDEVFSHSRLSTRRIATAGGGACKFAPLFRDALRVEMEPVKELSAVVDGLLLLAPHSASCAGAGDGADGADGTQATPRLSFEIAGGGSSGQEASDLFAIDDEGRAQVLPWPEPLFPLLVVNIGSGVSILRVDSAREGDYVRVGGTACGGATFLGLARTLTSARTFEEALALAEQGDARRVDKLVSDIYGEQGCANLGLPGELTASNFGKLSDDSECGDERCSEADLARALLQMVTQQSVLLAGAFARHAGCVGRAFFVGGFVDEPNWIARQAIAANFRSLGGCAYFLRHSDFLGALGSLKCALRAFESPGDDPRPSGLS